MAEGFTWGSESSGTCRVTEGRGHWSPREQQSKGLEVRAVRRLATRLEGGGGPRRGGRALSVGPGCPGFVCGHQGAGVLSEEGCSGQRALSGQWGRWGRWLDGRRRGGRPGGDTWERGSGWGSGLTLLTCWGGWMPRGAETVEAETFGICPLLFFKKMFLKFIVI